MTIATATDLRSRRIPNWLVVPFLLSGVVASVVIKGSSGAVSSLLGVGLAVVPMGLLYFLGGMGMGDVKLCAAVGAWVGPGQMVFVLVFMGLTGGIMAFAWSAYRGFLFETLTRTGTLLRGFATRGLRPHDVFVLSNPASRRMPYAPAIAAGALLSFLTC